MNPPGVAPPACPQCRAMLAPGEMMCRYCGMPLMPPPQPYGAPPPQQPYGAPSYGPPPQQPQAFGQFGQGFAPQTGYRAPGPGGMAAMAPLVKVIFSVGVVAILIVLWVVTATFTGKEPGEDCNGDGDCKGTNSVCLAAGKGATKYCSNRCTTNADCPSAEWSCETVSIIKIDNKGKQSAGGSEKVCALRGSKRR